MASSGLLRTASICCCAILAIAPAHLSQGNAVDIVRVWKVGSPHTGDTPHTRIPVALARRAAGAGVRIEVEAFPANGFTSVLLDAARREAAPDVLVFDNMGVIEGITTPLGTFDGIGRESTIRRDLIRVTDVFDELLAPARGWAYLLSSSPNHAAARRVALARPTCTDGTSSPDPGNELRHLVPTLARAYLEGDLPTIQAHADPERLSTTASKTQTLSVKEVRACGIWGNPRLAFVTTHASFDAETTLGHTRVVLVLRKVSSAWRLLAAARDPITTGQFVRELPSAVAGLLRRERNAALPAPAILWSPGAGTYPRPAHGQRFGDFTWNSSSSEDVIVEVAEFAYQGDARLVIRRPVRVQSRSGISAGQLWSTGAEWTWRVWSITRAGDVAFSSPWTFMH